MQISTESPHTFPQLPLTPTLTQPGTAIRNQPWTRPRAAHSSDSARLRGGLSWRPRAPRDSPADPAVPPVSSSLRRLLCRFSFRTSRLGAVTSQPPRRKPRSPCLPDAFSLRSGGGRVPAERPPRGRRALLRVPRGRRWDLWVTRALVARPRWSASIRHRSYVPPL